MKNEKKIENGVEEGEWKIFIELLFIFYAFRFFLNIHRHVYRNNNEYISP